MKLKFKTQAYQTAAVDAVVACFEGQPSVSAEALSYRADPGTPRKGTHDLFSAAGFRNADVALSASHLLENIRSVQRGQHLSLSDRVVATDVAPINLDVEMETGTGKTYCYIKTMFELNRRYGWSKFIVVVPSIAIREGVAKSLATMEEHFFETYRKKARSFIYSSRDLHQLESFSSDAGINVMIINVQAFAARGADHRRIYEALDDFQSRRPIDVISANRPILILDEPQKMEGPQTLKSLEAFNALMVLRYSATHRSEHNKVHRLDALDAYNQKLVKKIAVRGIAVRGLGGTDSYLYLQSIEVSGHKQPEARIEFEQKNAGGAIRRIVRRFSRGDDLFEASHRLDPYRQGFVIADIDAHAGIVSFTNGKVLSVGDATGDVTEATLRRIQIREAIRAHVEKEQALFRQGVKVLSLFFIDEVVKYRDYAADDEKGEYARIFEEEYEACVHDLIDDAESAYARYLHDIRADKTHKGYFSIDRKTRRLADPAVASRGENAGLSDDVDAYDLILKDKERLLSLAEPVRFIFSHSALREGWDNSNVFVICTLKQGGNTVSRRQEVGRGLRLSVNQQGERMDHPSIVHEVNVLTVVASESYKDFVSALQKDIRESLSDRPRVADEAYFTGKQLKTTDGIVDVTPQLAKQIYRYLLKNDYTDEADGITDAYHEARHANTLAPLPGELQAHAEAVFALIDSVFSDRQLPQIDDERRVVRNPLNANVEKQAFKALWQRINRKAAYSVDFDAIELVEKAVAALNDEASGLKVTPLTYTVHAGEQAAVVTYDDIREGDAFELMSTFVETRRTSVHSTVKYDLIGKLAEGTQLTRRTVADILKGLDSRIFDLYRVNPEAFIAEAIRLINEQKATVVVEHLAYDPIEERYDLDIFTVGKVRQGAGSSDKPLKRHIYDYVPTDSQVERDFVSELDVSSDVVVYAKLPRGFLIPTPVGDYNPDWAIAFREGAVKHVYFVAETKGSLSSMALREIEQTKIHCARRFFDAIGRRYAADGVAYGVVDSFAALMDIVK